MLRLTRVMPLMPHSLRRQSKKQSITGAESLVLRFRCEKTNELQYHAFRIVYLHPHTREAFGGESRNRPQADAEVLR